MKTRPAAYIVSAVLGLAGGILFGVQRTPADAAQAVQTASLSAAASGDQSGASLSPLMQRELADPVTLKLLSALREPVELRRRAAIQSAILALRPEDFGAALRTAGDLPSEFHYELISALFKRWMEVDPEAAQRWFREDRRFGGWTVSAWAEADPEGALRAGLSGTLGEKGQQLLTAIGAGISPADAPAHWAKLKQLPSGREREQALRNALYSFSLTDPVLAFAMAADLADEKGRTKARLSILQEWAKRDPEAALAQLNGILPEVKSNVLGNRDLAEVLDAVAGKNITLALDAISVLPSDLRNSCGIGVLRVWAKSDAVAALDWSLENGIEITRGHRLDFHAWQSSVLAEAMIQQPQKTVAWLQALDSPSQRAQLMESAFAEGISQVRNTEENKSLLAGLFAQLPAEAQARQAARLAEARVQEGPINDLSTWLGQFSGDATRQNAIAGALRAAHQQDATQAQSILAQLTQPADRDAALHGLSLAMAWKQPGDAAARALEISDPTLRESSLERVLVSWLKREPLRSREWLQNEGATLPAVWKDGWLKLAELGSD